MGHAHHINALRQALKQGRDGIAHASSPGGVIGGSRLPPVNQAIPFIEQAFAKCPAIVT